ncbi:hypothetical protein AD930_11250 [Acetobacter malorum]|nr:hypothetical protein AD930_11250 [Acetobacter malorum]
MAQSMVEDPKRKRPAILVNEPKFTDDIPADWPDDIVLADSRLCCPLYRASMTSFLARELPKHEVRWIWFRNEPNACRANLALRNASEAVVRDIDTLKWEYEVPEGVDALPVWRPDQP